MLISMYSTRIFLWRLLLFCSLCRFSLFSS